MGEYIPPTTKDVRRRFGTLGYDESFFEEEAMEFDAWLAKHDAVIREQVAEEIAKAIVEYAWTSKDFTRPIPEEYQAAFVASVGNAVEVYARIAREIGDQ